MIGQELFEMFKIDNDSTWGSDMDMVMGWEEFSREFIWNSTFELSSIAELSDATQLSKVELLVHAALQSWWHCCSDCDA